MTLLPPGGTFVDIGANCGMATLSAAKAVGPRGQIVAFEPNPRIAEVHSEVVRLNGLQSVATLHNAAIAEQDGKMDLFIPSSNHGEASLATQFLGRSGETVSVAVTSGKELNQLGRIDLVKIDVEGFEGTVARSISSSLSKFEPPVIMELMDEHLTRAGTSSSEVIKFMEMLGYRGFELTTRSAGLLLQRAALVPLDTSKHALNCNVLWLPRDKAANAGEINFKPLRK